MVDQNSSSHFSSDDNNDVSFNAISDSEVSQKVYSCTELSGQYSSGSFPTHPNSNETSADLISFSECESLDIYTDNSLEQKFPDQTLDHTISEPIDTQCNGPNWFPMEISHTDMECVLDETQQYFNRNMDDNCNPPTYTSNNTHVEECTDISIEGITSANVTNMHADDYQFTTDEVSSALKETMGSNHDPSSHSGLFDSEQTLSHCRQESSSRNRAQDVHKLSDNKFDVSYPDHTTINPPSYDAVVGEQSRARCYDDQVAMALVSDTIPIERSLNAETMLSTPDPSSLRSCLSGFQGLDQTDMPSRVVATDNMATSSLPMAPPTADDLLTDEQHCVWLTPPQSPQPNSLAAVHSADDEFTLPSDSLYVHGILLGRSTPMLVDTGASISVV